MIYGSVCSGIEAASCAWESLGWKPAWFCEINPFSSAVLNHHFPGVVNYGDFTEFSPPSEPVDVLVGGTPCQDFSVAGLRAGIAGDRGALTLSFVHLVGVLQPKWVVWENVPGVLSADGGRAFGALLGALAELGYGFAWRVLDAQYFGLAQRRKRVFVVGCAGGRADCAAAVLLEPEGVRRDPPTRRKEREGDTYEVAPCLTGSGRGVERSGDSRGQDPVVAVNVELGLSAHGSFSEEEGVSPPITSAEKKGHTVVVVPSSEAFHENQRGELTLNPIAGALKCSGGKPGQGYPAVLSNWRVRRLTPKECERLQGFPDNWTLIPYRGKPAAGSPRYHALGNSMAVPVMRWIGERIQLVENEGRRVCGR